MASTQLELRNRVYGYLNDLQSLTAFTGSGDRFPVYVVNSVINDSIRHYVKLLNSNYQGYLRTSLTINLLANVRTYALGSTFRSPVYDVRRTIDQIDFTLEPFNSYTISICNTPVPNSIFLPSYFLEQNNLVFNSFPMSDETNGVTVWFQGKVAPLVSNGDALPDTLYDMEDVVVLKTVVRLLQAKDVSGALKAISGWKEELKETESAFFQQVGNRYIKHDHPIPIQNYDEFYI